MDFLNTIVENILDVIFPANCLVCEKSGSYLCLNCLLNFPAAERETEKWIFPVFDYRDPGIKKALWFLKYKGKRKLAKIFAEILYEKILEELSELSVMENFHKPLLIPIPLSKKRFHERGYNQAALLCEEIVKINNLRSAYANASTGKHGVYLDLNENILQRIKDIEHQARIHNRKKRFENIIGSFSVKNPELIKNRNIILIDDITTTGATLNEARKILKKSGARKIIAFTVAH